MSGLENAVAQCRGVEANNGNENFDIGKDNLRLKNNFDAAANKLTEKNSGFLSFLKKGPSSDALRMALESTVKEIDTTSKDRLFKTCVDAGEEIKRATDAARDSKSAKTYIDSVSHQAPQVAGVRQSGAPQVAMNDNNFQTGVNMFKPGAQQSRLDAAMRAAGAN